MTISFYASILVTLLFLLFWDLVSWNDKREFYQKFEENSAKELDKTKYFEKIMKDYEKRYSDSSDAYSSLRRELIESNSKVEYWLISLLGSFLYFSFFMLGVIGYVGLVFPLLIIGFSAIVTKYKCDDLWLSVRSSFWYFLRSLGGMVAANIAISFMVGEIPFFLSEGDPILYRTITDGGWHLSLAGISFSFAVGLFIVLSLTSLLHKGRTRINEVKSEAIELLNKGKVDKLSKLYKKEEFSEIFEKYNDAKLAPRSILALTYLILVFIIFGLIFLYLATLVPPSPEQIESFGGTTFSDMEIFGSLALTMFLTFLFFFSLVRREMVNPKDN